MRIYLHHTISLKVTQSYITPPTRNTRISLSSDQYGVSSDARNRYVVEIEKFQPGNQVGLLDIAHTAKLREVTQLLKSLEKDLQENNLSTAGKSDAIALILCTRLMLIQSTTRPSSNPPPASTTRHNPYQRRTDLFTECMSTTDEAARRKSELQLILIIHRELIPWYGMALRGRPLTYVERHCDVLQMRYYWTPKCARFLWTRDTVES